ncbi:hypothetical protein [Mesoterricola silvestris]|uniref:Uncharacterized protein n=1 Tax=Mesoterricola silvestris TaxID=2927979 RepID=A0AA48H0Y8_9BACT|nr:hypothetical protein [Mesoterricola silvestris]BDU74023.1 hypothetical protein METEAL_31970 [Mesoterricola silvestris]
MIPKALTPLAACLLMAGVQANAQLKPATQNAEDQMSKLYMQVSNLLFGPANLKSMLVLQRPGTPLPDDFGEMSQEQRVMLNEIVDVVPMVNPNYVANGNMRYSQIFKAIAQNAQPTVKITLTPAEEAELKAAQDYVKDVGHSKLYEAGRNKYWEAVAKVEAASQNGKDAPSSLRAVMAAAKQDWDTQGGRVDYERRVGTIRTLGSKSGEAYWTALNQRLDAAATETNYGTFFYPQPKDWKSTDGWTEVRFDNNTKVDENQMSREAIKASVKGKHSWFSIDAAFSKTDFSASSLMDHKDLKISFKVKRVNIYRTWFDDLVLKNDAWMLPATVSFKAISYGNLLSNALKPCAMPLYTSALLLVKDLKLETALSQAEMSEYQHKMDIKAKIGLGPFTLSGSYSKHESGGKSHSAFTATGVSAPDIQILGLVGTAPDRSPASTVK